MIWNNCHQVRQRLPLLAESDLPVAERTVVERHLLQCPECRRQLSLTGESQAVLHEVRAVRPVEGNASVWPAVERQLAGVPFRQRAERPGWIPVGALTTACAALLFIGVFGPGFDSLPSSIETVEVIDGSGPSAKGVSGRGYEYKPSQSPYFNDTNSY